MCVVWWDSRKHPRYLNLLLALAQHGQKPTQYSSSLPQLIRSVLPRAAGTRNPAWVQMGGNDDMSCVRVSGAAWTETEVPGSYGCVHMTICRLKNGSWLALHRRWADQI
jgi:hypothetical protein